jgi:beta-lactamase class A
MRTIFPTGMLGSMRRALSVFVVLLSVGTSPARVAAVRPGAWEPDVPAAVRFSENRQGVVRFAVIDETGRIRGHAEASTVPMASVFKVMLMTGYLRRPSVRDRELNRADRDLLAPMIRRSDNATASRIRDILGAPAIHELARDAGMRDFRLEDPWGLSRTSARDQARFMFELESYIPDRHEAYGRRLLSSIVKGQRWGIPKAAPPGWDVYFKGGWGSGTGAVTHQVAFLESGERRIAIAVLTTGSPSHSHGTSTVRGVAMRLLRELEQA